MTARAMPTLLIARPRPGASRPSRRTPAFASAPRAEGAAPDWRPDDTFRTDLLSAIPVLRGFAMSLCGDAVASDDLVQETLLRAWANGHLFRPGTNMGAWLCTILRNQFYTAMRRRMREVEDADGEYARQLSESASQEGVVALKRLCAALVSMPKAQRQALIMVGAEGCTYEEAAKRLGCRVGTIKSRVSRARGRLLDPPHP